MSGSGLTDVDDLPLPSKDLYVKASGSRAFYDAKG